MHGMAVFLPLVASFQNCCEMQKSGACSLMFVWAMIPRRLCFEYTYTLLLNVCMVKQPGAASLFEKICMHVHLYIRIFAHLSTPTVLEIARQTLLPEKFFTSSGKARPSGLGGHTYRWVSAARLSEDQKKGHNFPSRRCQFVARISRFEIIPCLSLIQF